MSPHESSMRHGWDGNIPDKAIKLWALQILSLGTIPHLSQSLNSDDS